MIDTISKICAPFVLISIIDLVFLILIYKAYKRGNYERYNFYVRAGCVISILFIGVIVIALYRKWRKGDNEIMEYVITFVVIAILVVVVWLNTIF